MPLTTTEPVKAAVEHDTSPGRNRRNVMKALGLAPSRSVARGRDSFQPRRWSARSTSGSASRSRTAGRTGRRGRTGRTGSRPRRARNDRRRAPGPSRGNREHRLHEGVAASRHGRGSLLLSSSRPPDRCLLGRGEHDCRAAEGDEGHHGHLPVPVEACVDCEHREARGRDRTSGSPRRPTATASGITTSASTSAKPTGPSSERAST